MKITSQENAENLKEIINNTYEFIEKMQLEYLRQSMRTIIDYFEGKISISVVRDIELDFLRLCEDVGCEQYIVVDALGEFSTIYGGKWKMKKTKENHYWNTIYTLKKNGKKLRISAETNFSTRFMVFE